MAQQNATTDTTPMLKTKHIAKKFGMKPTQLRRILRSMPAYADGVHTNYAWAETDKKAIADIEKAIAARKQASQEKAAKAKAALAERAKAEKGQAQLDKKHAA